jgi:competence protein ComEC
MALIRRYTKALLLSVLAGLLCLPLFSCDKPVPSSDKSLEVVFLDVGQADTALISCEGHYMMIDGGNAADSNLIYSALQRRDISYLDYMVFSHTHEDHIGGLSGALQYVDVGVCYGSSDEGDTKAFTNFKRKLEEKRLSITIPQNTATFKLGEADVTVTHVTTDATDPNEDELVVRIVYGDTSFLFTGDIGQETEKALIGNNVELESTVLKVPHHGSAGSSGYQFLREVNPRYSVISVGEGNNYGHPTEEALSKYRDLGTTLYRTDLHGDVMMVSNGSEVRVTTQRQSARDVFGAGKAR